MYNYIEVETSYAVPSCACYKMIFKDGKWSYIYRFKYPKKYDIKDGLFVYGYICQLRLVGKGKLSPSSINIEVKNEDDLKELLRKQRNEDLKFRRKWIEEHPDYYEKCCYEFFDNEDQFIDGKFNIIKCVRKGKTQTKFIAASNIYRNGEKEE